VCGDEIGGEDGLEHDFKIARKRQKGNGELRC
jgi:hypothetical protein